MPGTTLTLRRLRDGDRLLIWMLIPDDTGEQQVAATVSVSKLPGSEQPA